MCLSCINTIYFIYRENFGDEIVDTEAFKKEVRTGPHEEMTLGEYIDVSTVYMSHTYTCCIWCGTYIYRHIHVRTYVGTWYSVPMCTHDVHVC